MKRAWIVAMAAGLAGCTSSYGPVYTAKSPTEPTPLRKSDVSTPTVTAPVAVIGSRGEILTGTATATPTSGFFEVANDALTCSGFYDPLSKKVVMSFSIQCRDGRAGIGTIVRDSSLRSGSGTVQMNNGETASFVMGAQATAYKPTVSAGPTPQMKRQQKFAEEEPHARVLLAACFQREIVRLATNSTESADLVAIAVVADCQGELRALIALGKADGTEYDIDALTEATNEALRKSTIARIVNFRANAARPQPAPPKPVLRAPNDGMSI